MKRGTKPTQKRRSGRQPATAPTPLEAAATARMPVRDSYETDVAPDLIDAGRTPDRSKSVDAECSLPPAKSPGRACP